MEQRESAVNRLVDRVEIEDLPRRYAHGIDARDWEQVDACFTADAHVHGTQYKGTYVEYMANLRKGVERYRTTMHFFGNQITTVGGDSAHVTTYGVAFHLGSDSDDFVIGVRYMDDVLRVGDAWKIAKRAVEGIWKRSLTGEEVVDLRTSSEGGS